MTDLVTASISTVVPTPAANSAVGYIQLQCPSCGKGPCRTSSTSEPRCSSCGYVFLETRGVYNALAPDREVKFRQFVHDYESVRAKEGRGSDRSDYYLVLPFKDLTGRNAWQWSIRARTFRFLE